MQRSAILTATLLSVFGLIYVGCTQDFDQFDPASTSSSSGTGGGSTSSSSSAGGAGGIGGMGGAGGATVSSSSSGTGGGMPCMNNGDCPDDTDCRNWSCNMGQCTFQDDADGTPLPVGSQMQNDCKRLVCDGAGNTKQVPNDMDTPDDGNDCTDDVCTNGTPSNPNTMSGADCNGGNGVCNGMGTCVECTKDADCGNGETCYMATNTCVSCTDGMMNGDETGIDCGGSCKKCNADACAMAAECGSNFCVDGACCDTACTGTCKACNVATKVGVCSDVPNGMDDTSATMTCMDLFSCNGMGACLGEIGAACMKDSDCFSNKCDNPSKKCI